MAWSNKFVVRKSSVEKNVKTKTESIVGIRHQATAIEDAANWKDFMCVVTVIFRMCNSVRYFYSRSERFQ
jgi:hypothetical protein